MRYISKKILRKKEMYRPFRSLDFTDLLIIYLFSLGHSQKEIARILNIHEAGVYFRRRKQEDGLGEIYEKKATIKITPYGKKLAKRIIKIFNLFEAI